MTAPLRTHHLQALVTRTEHANELGARRVKSPAYSTDQAQAARKWFAAMLWRAFPSRSENELAEKASAALGVSPRQVKNWLRHEHCAALKYVVAVIAIAGAEVVFQRMEAAE